MDPEKLCAASKEIYLQCNFLKEIIWSMKYSHYYGSYFLVLI